MKAPAAAILLCALTLGCQREHPDELALAKIVNDLQRDELTRLNDRIDRLVMHCAIFKKLDC